MTVVAKLGSSIVAAANGELRTASRTASRKDEHLRINLEEDVAAKGIDTGFDDFRLVHRALPGIDLADVDLRTTFLGRPVGAPLLISCMTGGTAQTSVINQRLARVAQHHRLTMGLGSCRVLLEQPDVLPSFDVREIASDVPLLANLGAVQLNLGVGVDQRWEAWTGEVDERSLRALDRHGDHREAAAALPARVGRGGDIREGSPVPPDGAAEDHFLARPRAGDRL